MLKSKYPATYFPANSPLDEDWLCFCFDLDTVDADIEFFGEFLRVGAGWRKIVWDWYQKNYLGLIDYTTGAEDG